MTHKSISITVLSGAPVGTKALFVLFFNNGIEDYNVQKTSSNAHANMDHVGFQVFSVEITDKTPAASDNG